MLLRPEKNSQREIRTAIVSQPYLLVMLELREAKDSLNWCLNESREVSDLEMS